LDHAAEEFSIIQLRKSSRRPRFFLNTLMYNILQIETTCCLEVPSTKALSYYNIPVLSKRYSESVDYLIYSLGKISDIFQFSLKYMKLYVLFNVFYDRYKRFVVLRKERL
jgi:hypothetical protein